MATAEKQKGFARQSLGDRLQASGEPMTMLKQNKSTILTDKNTSQKEMNKSVSNYTGQGEEGSWN